MCNATCRAQWLGCASWVAYAAAGMHDALSEQPQQHLHTPGALPPTHPPTHPRLRLAVAVLQLAKPARPRPSSQHGQERGTAGGGSPILPAAPVGCLPRCLPAWTSHTNPLAEQSSRPNTRSAAIAPHNSLREEGSDLPVLHPRVYVVHYQRLPAAVGNRALPAAAVAAAALDSGRAPHAAAAAGRLLAKLNGQCLLRVQLGHLQGAAHGKRCREVVGSVPCQHSPESRQLWVCGRRDRPAGRAAAAASTCPNFEGKRMVTCTSQTWTGAHRQHNTAQPSDCNQSKDVPHKSPHQLIVRCLFGLRRCRCIRVLHKRKRGALWLVAFRHLPKPAAHEWQEAAV